MTVSRTFCILTRKGVEHHFVEVTEGVVVEFDEDNQPIGIEIFAAAKVMAASMGQEALAVPVA
jgi:uncharacterized protein YuzE